MILRRAVQFIVGAVAGALLAFVPAAKAASPEVRATWDTTTGLTNSTSTVFDPATTTTNFKRLHDIGLNSV
jgi:hypothetical protein